MLAPVQRVGKPKVTTNRPTVCMYITSKGGVLHRDENVINVRMGEVDSLGT